MKRTLKFRLWNAEEKRWDNPAYVEVWDSSGRLTTMYDSDNFSITQYTGLNDSKGKEIFEGDILRVKHEDFDLPTMLRNDDDKPKITYKHCKVVWDNQGMWASEYLDWFRTCAGADDGKPVGGFVPYKDAEVIGNIFENPELCK